MNIYTLFCIFMQNACGPVCSLPVFFETKGAKIIIWVVNIYDVTRLAEQRTIIPYTECV